MQRLPPETIHRFMAALWGVRQRVLRRTAPVLHDAHGLDPAEYHLLGYIAETRLSPTEIADAMMVPAFAVSRRLDALVKGGLVERSIDPDDARRRVLEATPAGLERLARARASVDEALAGVFPDLDPDEVATLVHLLERAAGLRPADAD